MQWLESWFVVLLGLCSKLTDRSFGIIGYDGMMEQITNDTDMHGL